MFRVPISGILEPKYYQPGQDPSQSSPDEIDVYFHLVMTAPGLATPSTKALPQVPD
jgi:hypothetical protein